MEVDANGNYTRRVDGECVEKRRKVRAITKWANEKYGAGNWELSCAFGDHHSDIPMLSRAADAFAITPDSTLSRTARENDWHALDWNCKGRNSASEPLGSRFRRGVRVCRRSLCRELSGHAHHAFSGVLGLQSSCLSGRICKRGPLPIPLFVELFLSKVTFREIFAHR